MPVSAVVPRETARRLNEHVAAYMLRGRKYTRSDAVREGLHLLFDYNEERRAKELDAEKKRLRDEEAAHYEQRDKERRREEEIDRKRREEEWRLVEERREEARRLDAARADEERERARAEQERRDQPVRLELCHYEDSFAKKLFALGFTTARDVVARCGSPDGLEALIRYLDVDEKIGRDIVVRAQDVVRLADGPLAPPVPVTSFQDVETVLKATLDGATPAASG